MKPDPKPIRAGDEPLPDGVVFSDQPVVPPFEVRMAPTSYDLDTSGDKLDEKATNEGR